MGTLLLFLLVVLVVFLIGVTFLFLVWYRPPSPLPSPPPPAPPAPPPPSRELEQLGSELLARRIDLEARRGALQGNESLDQAFTRLEERLRQGDITPEEFEREKIRLLGG